MKRIEVSTGRFIAALSILLLSTPVLLGAEEGLAQRDPADSRVYHYRMRGSVRLLFFWIGKDDVGGGHIALTGGSSDFFVTPRRVEVLFGSNPERVPGKVNRWGYGWEETSWSETSQETGPELVQTVFEGFMRHSNEDNLKEVQKNNDNDQATQSFVYDGIRSVVRRDEAVSEIRTFAVAQELSYRKPEPLRCRYQVRSQQPPDKVKVLDPPFQNQERPYGFLTATAHFVQRALQAGVSKEQRKRLENEKVDYVYNARLYELRVEDVSHHETFEIRLDTGEKRKFSDVVELELEIKNMQSGDEHGFNLWLPLEGPYRGVPVRIVDKPRWWLKVELDLVPERTELVSAANRPSDPCNHLSHAAGGAEGGEDGEKQAENDAENHPRNRQ